LSGGADVQALNVKQGELVLSGEQTLHAGNVLYADDWRFHSYLADTAKVLTGATLTVSDHAELSADTTVDEGAILNLYAHAALSGNLVLTGINSLLKADIVERDSTVAGLSSMITADVSGNGQLIKTGEGTLQVDGDITTTGDTELRAGTLALNGNVSSPVKMASGTVLAGSGTLQDLYAADQSTPYPGALFANTAQYATLRVGSLYNTGTVNVALNSDFSRTATDKLLVDGDVIGDKPILVSVSSQSPWTDSDINQNSIADNTEGVSIIQVGGQSTKDSFALAGNYMARGAWAYGLYAFAPGKSAESERDVSGTGDQYWDYRLQNIMLSEGGNSTPAVPDETPAAVPDETPAAVPDETPAVVPDETPAVVPDETPAVVPDETPAVVPDETPAVVPDETPAVVPDETPAVVPDETPAVVPDEAPAVVPDEAPAVVPDETPTVVPDETPAVVPDEAPAVVPDEAPAVVPDETPAASPPQPVKPVRRAVTPQVPSYISLPSALFRADEQRTILFKESALDASLEGHSSFFLFGYRGEENYQSGNGFMQYGYNYKSRDKGWMMGANLASWQNEGQSLSVSGAFSKGDTTFTPEAVDGDSQGSFHSNAVNLMVSWHDEDYYLNLLSGYGWSKGDITTNLRGKVASPHVKQTFAEIEGGKNLRFGAHRLRPYAGYRHQQMQVKSFTDVDNTRVNYHQQRREAWIGGLAYDYTLPLNRLGTLRLGTDVSLAMRPSGQGKVTIGDGQQSDAFRTGNGGDNLNIKTEAKLELSQDIALTTQIRHQRKLQQEGTNDWLFAGGINFYF
jgi:serine protease autotransporter